MARQKRNQKAHQPTHICKCPTCGHEHVARGRKIESEAKQQFRSLFSNAPTSSPAPKSKSAKRSRTLDDALQMLDAYFEQNRDGTDADVSVQ